jgi:hypothetical protein
MPIPRNQQVAIVGMLTGQLIWAVLYAAAGLGNFIAFAAAPVEILGWVMV